METLLFSNTPSVAVLDNRGLGVREIVYHRHPDSPDITDERITRHTFTPAGHLLMSRSPRQYDLIRNDPSVLPDREVISSLTGQPLKVTGCDDGTTLAFHDAANRPVLAVSAGGITRRWGYEGPELPGRLLSVTESRPGQNPHLHETQGWGSNTQYEKDNNLAGQCTERQDETGLYWLTSVSLTGQPLTRMQQLLADDDEEEDRASRLPQELLYMYYTYDATGELLTQTDARGNRQRQVLDVAGLLKQSWLTPVGGTERAILQSVRYSAAGQVLEEVHGNGVVTTYTYEAQTQRLTGIKTARPAGHSSGAKVLQDLRYEYDPVGNVVSVSNDAEATRFWRNQKVVPESRYVYDSLYQLVRAIGREMAGVGQQSSSLPDVTLFDNATYTNYTRAWTYDSNGNLTQIRHSAPATGNNHTTNITVSNRSNRGVISDLAANPENVEALFSAGGHQLQLLAGQVLHWTLREELHRVTLVNREESRDEEVYRYNADAKRVVKTRTQVTGNSTQTEEVVYLESLELRNTYRGAVQTAELTVSLAGKARLLHWVSGKPENISNDQIRYSHGSLNENCSLETDENGLLISLEEYYPFGGTAVWAARSAVEAEYKTIRYSGKERDVTGLYYYGYRYYQAWAGRWLSADPAGTIDGLNLFRMCRNNPVTYRDPFGLDPDSEEDTVATLFTPEKLELSPHIKNILDAKAQQKEGKEKKQYNILFISAKKNKNSFDPRSSDIATTEFSRERMSYLMHKGHNVKGAYVNTAEEFKETWNAIGKGSLKDINKVIIDYHGAISPKRGHESVLVLSTDPQILLFDRKDIESLEEKSTVDVVSLAACYSGFVERFNPAVGFLDKLTKPGAHTVGFDAQGDNNRSKMKTLRHADPGDPFTNALSALKVERFQYGRVKYKKTSDNEFQIDYKPGFKEMSKVLPRSQYFN